MLQSAVCDSLSFDPFSLCQDGGPASEVDVGRGEIVDAFVVAAVVVVGDEGFDPGFEAAMYSLIESAKLNSLNPQLYLADLLTRIADYPARRVGDLLPWNWQPGGTDRAAA